MSFCLHNKYLKINIFTPIFLLGLLLSSWSQAQVIWSSPSNTSWLTGSNWVGSVAPTATQIAEFDANPTSATTGVGIDMNAAAGSLSISGLYISSTRTNNFLLGNNSATSGTLSISGDLINGTPNVFIANFSAGPSKLTIQNTQGSGSSTLGLNLGSSAGNFTMGSGGTTTAGNTISVTSAISATGLLTVLGGGTWNAITATGNNGGILKLGGANTFTGGITAGSADGTGSGILELDVNNAINNSTGNNITVNPNSQLYLAATTGSTYTTDNITLYLNGLGNNYASTGKGAMVNLSGSSYTWTGPVNLSTDASISVLGSSTVALTLGGNISGSGKLIKEGPGNLIINGATNTWAGGMQLNKGTITVNAGSSLPVGDIYMNAAAGSSIVFNNSQTITSLSSNFGVSTGSFSQTISLAAATTLTIDQATNTTYGNGAVTSLTSNITGSGSVVKTGSGTLTLTSTGNTFSGGLTISGGTLRLSPVSAPSTIASNLRMNGGTLSTNGIAAVTLNFGTGTFALTDNSTLDFDVTNTHYIKFANSSAVTWTTGKILTVTNWTGAYNSTAGTKGRLFIGTGTTGLTATQLAQIHFDDGMGHIYAATQLVSGEVVPLAPLITIATGSYGPFCNNISNTISVAYTSSGPFTGTYKVQLSGPAGTFTADTLTGIIGSGTTSPLAATIPTGTAAGTGYRIRVINTSPVVFGANNGANIAINGLPIVNVINGTTTLTPGATITLTDASSGGTWHSSDTTVAKITTGGVVTGIGLGTDTITYTVTNTCGLSTTVVKLLNVVAAPQIFGVTPNTGVPGDTIIITGSNFNPASADDIVYFGATKAIVTSASASSLKVTVPFGAAYSPVSVTDTTLNVTAASMYAFMPTYNNTGLIPAAFNFKPKVDLAAGGSPIGIYLADLDGDGKSDMVVVNSGPNNMYVYHNIGTGTGISAASFAAPQIYATGSGPHYIKIADIDGDGKLDVIVTNTSTSSNNISIFRNTSTPGSITFAAKVNFGAGGSGPYDLGIADIDGDDKPDVVITNQNTTSFTVLRNKSVKGTLSFSSAATFSIGYIPLRLFTGDIDGDGKPDVATISYFSGFISVFHNTATPGIINSSSFATPSNINLGAGITAINAADIDGDGKPDLLATNSNTNLLSVYRNTSAPGTITFASNTDFGTDSTPEDIEVGDIDGDGKVDIIVANYGAGSLSIFRNAAVSGTISASSLAGRVSFAAGTSPSGMAIGDLDGDQKPDIALVNGGASTVSIFRNYPLPPVGIITGADSLCMASTTTFTDSIPGGIWVSSNPAVATINSSGMVTAVAQGLDTIAYYTVAQGDTNIVRHPIRIDLHLPVGVITSTATSFCVGATLPLTDTPAHGMWSSSNITVATVDTVGNVTAHATGNVIITYAISNSCGATQDTMQLTVTPPTGYTIGTITGTPATCITTPVTFTDTSAGGTWTSSNTSVANVNTSGVVSGASYGTAVITYGVTNSCGTYVATSMITIDTITIPAALTGADSLCQGTATIFSTPQAGGIWSVSNATASASGDTITGTLPGTDTITYTLTNTCGTVSASKTIVTKPAPFADTILGLSSVCPTDTIVLADSASGGVWSRTNTHASVSPIGVVTGITGGVDTILYSVTNSCGTAVANKVVSVVPVPNASAISGPSAVCVGASITLGDTATSGVWTISNANATIADSVVSGVSIGLDTVTFTVTNMCGTYSVIKPITVNPALLDPGVITGLTSVCVHDTIYLVDTISGGIWGKTNTKANVSNTGMVVGQAAGIDTIKYTLTNACGNAVATYPVTVNPLPSAGTITGATAVCAGSSIIIHDTTSNGSWTITNGFATLAGDSIVTGVSAGTDTVKYTVTNSCGIATAIKRITISPLPYAASITGSSNVYVGDTIILKDSTAGGVWKASNTNAIVSNGNVGGLQQGIDTISYVVTNSCGRDTAYFYVDILPQSSAGLITDFQVYPNPGNGSFTITLTSRIDQSIKVILANSVYQSIAVYDVNTNKPTAISAPVLSAGDYFLSAVTKQGWYTVKVVIFR